MGFAQTKQPTSARASPDRQPVSQPLFTSSAVRCPGDLQPSFWNVFLFMINPYGNAIPKAMGQMFFNDKSL